MQCCINVMQDLCVHKQALNASGLSDLQLSIKMSSQLANYSSIIESPSIANDANFQAVANGVAGLLHEDVSSGPFMSC